MSDPHRFGEFRFDYTRLEVIDPLFESWIAQGYTVQATRLKRIVSTSSDLYTRHPNITYEESVIDVCLVTTSNMQSNSKLDIGAMGDVDAVVKTAYPLMLGDRLRYGGNLYEVNSQPVDIHGREGGFLYRKAGLKRIVFEES